MAYLLAVNCLQHIVVVCDNLLQVTAEQAQVKLSAVPEIAWTFSGMNLSWYVTNKNNLPDLTELRLDSNFGTYLLQVISVYLGSLRVPTPLENLGSPARSSTLWVPSNL